MIKIKETTKKLSDMDYEELYQSNQNHRTAVRACLKLFQNMLKVKANVHDRDKFTEFKEMYRLVKAGKAHEWVKIHALRNRHHLQTLPEDVNLLDILECLIDTVVAYKTNGLTPSVSIDPSILAKAVDNTIKLLSKEMI